MRVVPHSEDGVGRERSETALGAKKPGAGESDDRATCDRASGRVAATNREIARSHHGPAEQKKRGYTHDPPLFSFLSVFRRFLHASRHSPGRMRTRQVRHERPLLLPDPFFRFGIKFGDNRFEPGRTTALLPTVRAMSTSLVASLGALSEGEAIALVFTILHAALLFRVWSACRKLSHALAACKANKWRPAAAVAGAAAPEFKVNSPLPEAVAQLPLVSDLVRKHAAALQELREHPDLVLDSAVHDDLYLLRYVLSAKGNVAKAASAIRKQIEWRRENGQMLSPEQREKVRAEAAGWAPTANLPWRTAAGQPVSVAAAFLADLDAKPEDFHFTSGVTNREDSYELCDRLTRESGRLVKLVIIQDMRGFSLNAALRYSRYTKIQGKLSKLSEFLYPQLVQVVVVAHPPSVLNRLFGMVKGLVSERLLEKIRVCPSTEEVLLRSGLAREHLPTFLGGEFQWDAVDWN